MPRLFRLFVLIVPVFFWAPSSFAGAREGGQLLEKIPGTSRVSWLCLSLGGSLLNGVCKKKSSTVLTSLMSFTT